MTEIKMNSTAQWQARDARHHLHSFTDPGLILEQGSRIIVRGEGSHVWDSDGRKILDGMAGGASTSAMAAPNCPTPPRRRWTGFPITTITSRARCRR